MDVLRRHGAQGQLDEASKAVLDNEFGSHNEDEVIKQILTKGQIQMSEVSSPVIDGLLTRGTLTDAYRLELGPWW
jgi:hypothetical protein